MQSNRSLLLPSEKLYFEILISPKKDKEFLIFNISLLEEPTSDSPKLFATPRDSPRSANISRGLHPKYSQSIEAFPPAIQERCLEGPIN